MKFFTTFLISLSLFGFVIFRYETMYRKRAKVIRAISRYQIHCRLERMEQLVDYKDVYKHSYAVWRIWDWSYKRILPKEKFEIIKPFMEE